MNIIGFYKNYRLVEQDGKYLVVNKQERRVVFAGDEETASKLFIMLAAEFIDEKFMKVE